MLKKLTAILIAALVVVLGLFTAVVIIANQPAAVLEQTVENTLDDLTEREELALLFDILEKGSLEISVPESNRVYGTGVEGKLYFDGFLSSDDPEMYVENLTVTKDEQSFTGDLYLSKDYAYFRDADEDAYGMVSGEMKEAFLASPLAAENDTPWSLTATVSEDVAVLMEIFDDRILEDLDRDLEKALKKYEKKLKKLLTECLEIDVEAQDVTVGGESLRGRVITVSVDEDAAAEILMGVFDMLSEDEKLRDKVLSYGAYFCEKLNIEFDVTQWYDEKIMSDEVWDALANSIRSTNFEYTVKIVTPMLKATACQLTVTMFTEGETLELCSVDVGPKGISDAKEITVESLTGTHILRIEENSKDAYRLAYYQKFHENETRFGRLEIDRRANTYILSDNIDTYTGSFIAKGRRVEMTIDQCVNKFGSTTNYGIRMVLNGSDAMPKPVRKGNVKPLFDLTEEKLERIHDLIGGGLRGSYTGMIYGFNTTLTFHGAGRVELSTTYGDVAGYYCVWDDQITFTFEEPSQVNSVLNTAIFELEGTFDLIVKENHIRIGRTQFNQS